MSKVILACILLIVVLAFAESDFNEGESKLVMDGEVSLLDITMKAKLSQSIRSDYRAQLQDAWASVNLDFDLIEEQELLEETGAGYAEMGPIMIKVNELESTIKAKIVSEDKVFSESMTTCRNNKKTIDDNIKTLNQRIKSHNANVVQQSLTIKNSEAKKLVSASRIQKYLSQVSNIKSQRARDYDGYRQRRDKRMNEMTTLRKALVLVCTFTEFIQSETCKINVVGRELDNIDAKFSTTGTNDIDKLVTKVDASMLKQQAIDDLAAKAIQAKVEEGRISPPTVSKEVKKEDTVQSLLEMNDDQLKAHRTNLSNIIHVNLSEDNFVSLEVAKPIRLLLLYAHTGQLAEDPGELPPLLWNLFTRITTEMSNEANDMDNLLKTYDTRIREMEGAALSETKKQNAENLLQIACNSSISNSQVTVVLSQNELDANVTARILESKRCQDITNTYTIAAALRRASLRNIDELRSLLRVLQNSDLPKCQNDCTSVTQGKCIWEGLFGKQSYCKCSTEYYGDACEFKKCPGVSTLLRHNEVGVCNNNGACDKKTGICACKLPYFHGTKNSCELKHCRDGTDLCGGASRGTCNTSTGTCECTSTYHGGLCEYTKCIGVNNQLWKSDDTSNACNGANRGACNSSTGECKCKDTNFGSSCQYFNCNYNCNGHGNCNTGNGTCACIAHYSGQYCQSLSCVNNCSGNGNCMANGVCSCNDGTVGNDCRKPGSCGSTVGTTYSWFHGGLTAAGWSDCPQGYLMTSIYYSSGLWLNSLNYFGCSRPCDNNDIAQVRYTKSTSFCVNANWWTSFNVEGWSTCPPNTFLAGLLRNSNGCEYLYCVEEARCCRVNGTLNSNSCNTVYWGDVFQRSNGNRVTSPGYFISKIYRIVRDHTVRDIHSVYECRYSDSA